MQALINVLQSLGLDYSVVYQLGIFIVTYIILTKVLFKPLLNVLVGRIEATKGLELKTLSLKEDADKLKAEYETKITKVRMQALSELRAIKFDLKVREHEEVKKKEKELNDYLDKERQALSAEFSHKRASIMNQTDSLADELVKRIVQ